MYQKKLRYNELHKEIGNITNIFLANTFKGLVNNNLVLRKSYGEISPRVEYQLTEKGKSVVAIL